MRNGLGRIALLAAFAALPLLGPSRASAYVPPGPFDEIQAELEFRRDNDFLGDPLDAALKKQQKAVLKSLALLARPAGDLRDDFSTFVSVAKSLEKAYPEEFVFARPALRDILWNTRGALISAFETELADLHVRIGKIAPSKGKDKALALYAAASSDSHTGIAGGSISTHAKLLVKAWKERVKARGLADRGTVLPEPSLTFTVDGTPYTAGVIEWSVDTSLDQVNLHASYTDPGTGNVHNVSLQATGVTGPGFYPLDSNGGSLGYWMFPPTFLTEFWDTDATGGFLTVDSLDVAASSMSGSFTFTATGGPSSTQVLVVGTFTATWNLTVSQGMGD